jgi:hypothetical protein
MHPIGKNHYNSFNPKKVTSSNPSIQAPKTTSSINQLKPPFISTIEKIDLIQSINGISIEAIEARARPGKEAISGFLGKEESFKEVLKKDWETVTNLKVTHVELSAHLRKILEVARQTEEELLKNKKITVDELDRAAFPIEYNTNQLAMNTIFAPTQQLKVKLQSTKGYQSDIFMPEDESQRQVDTPKKWSEEHYVTDKNSTFRLYLNSGILSYIHNFGFYEGGGEENRYRVDPTKIMSLLTGKSLEELNKQ